MIKSNFKTIACLCASLLLSQTFTIQAMTGKKDVESKEVNYLNLIFPYPEKQILLIKADKDQSDKMQSGKVIDKNDILYKEIMKDIAFPFHQSILKLTQCSRNFKSRQDEPNILYISQDEGGWIRKGITFIDYNGEKRKYPGLHYVDLNLDKEGVRRGDMHIFSHEFGHIMMDNIFPSLRTDYLENTTSKQHVGMGITDNITALYEGWGIHYQVFANEKIKNNYLEKDFYNKFLIKNLPGDVSPEHVFNPLENVALKHFYVWNSLESNPPEKHPLLIEFIIRWCRFFPEDKKELISLFISLSNGISINDSLVETFKNLRYHGIIGDYEQFLGSFRKYPEKYEALVKKAIADPAVLSKNVGPELWIVNEDVLHRKYLWMPEPKVKLRFNLNTASVFEIYSMPWIDFEKAEEIIKLRNRKGYFISIEELSEYGF